MIRMLCFVSVALCAVAQPSGQTSPRPPEVNSGWDRITRPYRPPTVPPPSYQNSPRLNELIRAGQLYLSLPDAIALALENNLDVELQRYGPGIAASDLLRAQGGATTRGVTLSVGEPPSGMGGPSSPLLKSRRAER